VIADSFAGMFVTVTATRFDSFCNETWCCRWKLSLVLRCES